MPTITGMRDRGHKRTWSIGGEEKKCPMPAPTTCAVIRITICRGSPHSFLSLSSTTIYRMGYSLAGDFDLGLSRGDPAAARKDSEMGSADFRTLKPRDFDQRPLLVIWEMTQACDLKCAHCRANSRPHRHPLELSTAEAFHLIDQIAAMKVPLFVLTGGDPLKRPDLLPIVQYACQRRVRTSLTPSTTPLLVRNAVFELKQSGLMRLAVSLDGSTAELHDGFRGVPGSYQRSIDAVGWCHEAGLPVQVNTTVSRRNLDDLDNLIHLLADLRVVLWSVFFLVPTGRAQQKDLLTAEEHEQVFAKLYETSKRVKFHIKTTEGQHYRRYVLQQRAHDSNSRSEEDFIASAPRGVNDGKGFVFVSHTGEVYPSGFLPLPAGNVLWEPLSEIYRNSPLFRSLRDRAQLKGKCGRCEFNEVCGGSRARAYALRGDPLAEEPCCAYLPQG
jgi:radical SAM protein